MKNNPIIYDFTSGVHSWTLIKTKKYYKVVCLGPDITYTQKYSGETTPRDVLQAELAMISTQLKGLVNNNTKIILFLNDTLSYIKEEIYDLKFVNI